MSDPFVPRLQYRNGTMRSTPVRASTLRAADCVVIATDHDAFDYHPVSRHARAIVDCRNALKGRRTSGVFRI